MDLGLVLETSGPDDSPSHHHPALQHWSNEVWGPQHQRLALDALQENLLLSPKGTPDFPLSPHSEFAQPAQPQQEQAAAAAAAQNTGKRPSTRLNGGSDRIISQDELLDIILQPGASDVEVTQHFTFRRTPTSTRTRKSTVLQMTERQLDIMYAVAGCADVAYLVSNLQPQTRQMLLELYDIDKSRVSTWFKNRGYDPCKGNTQGGKRHPGAAAATCLGAPQTSLNPRPKKQKDKKPAGVPPSVHGTVAVARVETANAGVYGRVPDVDVLNPLLLQQHRQLQQLELQLEQHQQGQQQELQPEQLELQRLQAEMQRLRQEMQQVGQKLMLQRQAPEPPRQHHQSPFVSLQQQRAAHSQSSTQASYPQQHFQHYHQADSQPHAPRPAFVHQPAQPPDARVRVVSTGIGGQLPESWRVGTAPQPAAKHHHPPPSFPPASAQPPAPSLPRGPGIMQALLLHGLHLPRGPGPEPATPPPTPAAHDFSPQPGPAAAPPPAPVPSSSPYSDYLLEMHQMGPVVEFLSKASNAGSGSGAAPNAELVPESSLLAEHLAPSLLAGMFEGSTDLSLLETRAAQFEQRGQGQAAEAAEAASAEYRCLSQLSASMGSLSLGLDSLPHFLGQPSSLAPLPSLPDQYSIMPQLPSVQGQHSGLVQGQLSGLFPLPSMFT